MPRVSMFLLCDSINHNATPAGPSLIAPMVALRPQYIPGNYSFGISVGVCDLNENIANKLRISISDPNGKLVENIVDVDIPLLPPDALLPQHHRGFVINVDVRNLPIDVSGEYSMKVFINDDLIGSHVIPIYKRC